MSANTTVYVKVLRTIEDTIEVSALTLQEGKEIAVEEKGVVCAIGAAYSLEELVERP